MSTGASGAYIRAKQKLIALLNEQKQAIIHRAVTRGLDPNVRLKPSGVGVAWRCAEHWEVERSGILDEEWGRPRSDAWHDRSAESSLGKAKNIRQ